MSGRAQTLINGRLVLETGVLDSHTLTIGAGLIESIDDRPEETSVPTWDCAGRFVVPGLVDVHVHGAEGVSFNDPRDEAWRQTLASHARRGSTTVLATVATAPWQEMIAALDVGLRLIERAAPGLAGLHLEGPYLNPDQRGAHGEAWLRTPADQSWRELERFWPATRVVTLAPELAGSAALIEALARRGIVVAAGHSAATPEVIESAFKIGLRHFTHLWSGQTRLSQQGPWRQIGLLETALSSDGMSAELIADGAHAPAALTQIAYRCLGADRLCLISDASAGAGMAKGCHFRMGSAAGVVDQGVALSDDGLSFCGSTSYLSDVLRFAVESAGVSIVDGVRMAATTPARLLGLESRIGRLAPGLDADLLLLDKNLEIRAVMQKGHWLIEPRERARKDGA